MKKSTIIILGIIGFVLCAGVTGIIFLNSYLGTPVREISNEEFEKSVKITEESYELTEEAKNIKVRDREAVFTDIHKMANTKIIPVDGQIWGEKEINEENLNAVFVEVIKSDFKDKDKLIEILEAWKKKDYSQSVEAHNYVWNQLGGTVGKAKALKEE